MSPHLNDYTVWPFSIHQGIPLQNMLLSYNPSPIPQQKLPQNLVNYILQICLMKQYSPKSFQSTLRITSRYLRQTSRLHSIQLISLVALMLATKFYDYYYFTVAEIHEMSNHEFTNKGNLMFMEDIHEMEETILITLGFNLFVEPIKDVKEENREKIKGKQQLGHANMYQMLLIAMEMVSILIPKQLKPIFYECTNAIFYLYFHMLFTHDFKKPLLRHLCDSKIVICLILNITMIVMTQSKGDFPQIMWIKQVLKVKESQNVNGKDYDDQFDRLLTKLMEILFGQEMKEIQHNLKEFWIKQ